MMTSLKERAAHLARHAVQIIKRSSSRVLLAVNRREYEQDGITYAVTPRFAEVSGFTGSPRDVVIPMSVRGVPVVSVTRRAFADCASLSSVHLPNSVITISPEAFLGCRALESIKLSEDLESIGDDAFKGCSALSAVYYQSMRGLGDDADETTGQREDVLPISLAYLGSGAFESCESLTQTTIPYRITNVLPRTFAGCTALSQLGLHRDVEAIGENAFASCTSLAQVRVPSECVEIGGSAFEHPTVIVADDDSAAAVFAAERGLSRRPPTGIEIYEIGRPPLLAVPERDEPELGDLPAPRFTLTGDSYTGTAQTSGEARIMMVGDLMANSRQQRTALRYYDFQFDESFRFVNKLLGQADFVIGNLETMLAPSAPYAHEQRISHARPHLNAPPSYAAALRRAGFDAVGQAQNHVYDTGIRGIVETLDAVKDCGLISVGLYLDKNDRRHRLIDIGGITIGILAYLDEARQPMKRVNFTRAGSDVLFPYFDRSRIEHDVEAAKADGAEFVLAYAHWGREFTPQVNSRQRRMAQFLVDAGVDYIVGAHPHCLQPYEVLTAKDGREVPCLWSAGNFLSGMGTPRPITRDTLILDLTLARDAAGSVRIKSHGYHPCRIMNRRNGDHRNFVTIPTSTIFTSPRMLASLAEARDRIIDVVGLDIEPITRPISR